MISRSANRVQAIKSKFENLNLESEGLNREKSVKVPQEQLLQEKPVVNSFLYRNECTSATTYNDKENSAQNTDISIDPETKLCGFESDSNENSIRPNDSYLHSKSNFRNLLTRQSSDPGKKLHRSHAFRCDRTQKVGSSPKRHDSFKVPAESNDVSLRPSDKRLSRDRLRKLGHVLGDQMKKECFVMTKTEERPTSVTENTEIAVPYCSIPDQDVPQHILDQYAQVIKNKKKLDNAIESKQDAMSDSGVSSETENVDDDKCRLQKLKDSQFPSDSNLAEDPPFLSNLTTLNSEISASCKTLRLEKKNPHIVLTETLKKALKQPLPPGPPPKKPPRTFTTPPVAETSETSKSSPKKNTKSMLAKLEQILQQREAKTQSTNCETETEHSPKPKEIHYLCTNIIDLNHRTTEAQKNCFDSFNCIIKNQSTLSLPYSKLMKQNSSRNCNSYSSEDLDMESKPILSTFKSDKTSLVPLKNEPVYEVPFRESLGRCDSIYGVVKCNSVDNLLSGTKENLRSSASLLEPTIYDIPCDSSAPTTPIPETVLQPQFQFDKLLSNFETGIQNTEMKPEKTQARVVRYLDKVQTPDTRKPKPKEKPVLKPSEKRAKSTENLSAEFQIAKKCIEKKFATESKRYRKNERNAVALTGLGLSISKKDKKDQLDVDRENLNRLMNEIYDTVTAACRMEEQKPTKFPTESDAANEDSNKLTRSLTEKRKNYVRRISSRAAYLDPKSKNRYRHQTSICSYKSEILDNTYSTFRSWKSFRNSQCNITKMVDMDKMADLTDSKVNLTDSSGNLVSMNETNESVGDLSLDDKAGCLDLDLPFEPRYKGLFDICLLVGLNYMTGQAYVKSVFPSQVKVPPHIENLIFPETMSQESSDTKIDYEKPAKDTQTYSLVLTDEKGERNYGYCRRVLPEGATCCLPLCYCVIGRYRAPGFYNKVLKEIESHHGSSEVEINTILQQLFETDFPSPGEEISLTYLLNQPQTIETHTNPSEVNPVSDSDFSDAENNNSADVKCVKTKVITRSIEPRVDESCVGVLLDSLGAGLLIKVFGTLLLERKVVLISDKLSQLSSCMEGLQSILYPLVWQQPLISGIPASLQRDILEAPLPLLAGSLQPAAPSHYHAFQEGMLIDISRQPAKVLFYHGDESSILPAPSYKALKTSLQAEQAEAPRRLLAPEGFLRFFVDVLGGFWGHFRVADVREGDLGKGGVVFQKEAFIKSASSKQHQYFLEWFTETAMFNHFIQNMAASYQMRQEMAPQPLDYSLVEGIVDAPLPNYYELFDERLTRNCKKTKSLESNGKTNYKNAVNKKVKLLKSKLLDLVT